MFFLINFLEYAGACTQGLPSDYTVEVGGRAVEDMFQQERFIMYESQDQNMNILLASLSCVQSRKCQLQLNVVCYSCMD